MSKYTAVFFCLAVLSSYGSQSMAGDCRRTGQACLDSTTPSKTISGVTIAISQVDGCWEWEDSYECLKPNAINYCQPLINAQPKCWQTNSQCAQMDAVFNSGCMKHTQTWRCADPSTPTPSNTTRLDDTYTLISSDYDPGPCQSLADNPSCQIAESQCLSTTPPSLPASIDPATVAPDGCYQKQNTYACLTGRTDSSECDGYASNPNCNLQSQSCSADSQVNDQCVFQENTYRCQTSPAITKEVEDCSARSFCANGECFDTGFEPDADFGKAVAAMESAREAGTYIDPNSLLLFTGAASKCTKKLGGLSNCCKKGSGGGSTMSNRSVASGMVSDLVGQAASYGYSVGSAYTYDAMFSSDIPWMMSKSIDAWQLGNWNGSVPSFSPTVGLYGFSAAMSAPTASPLMSSLFGTAANPIQLAGSAGGPGIYFTPATFYIAIAMMVIQELMSCDPEDQMTAMKAGQNLCVALGSYCSQKFLKICVEKKEGYCCFNSRLARIIQEQGRVQLGKSWGSPQSPECSGFSTAEFESLDFSRIDMTEFIREVQPKAMDVQALANRMNSRVQTMANH